MSGPMAPILNPIRPTESLFQWVALNRDGVMIGAIVAAVIVSVMLIARMVGQRMVAREATEQHFGWRGVVGRVLARTAVAFMVVAAIDIVASYADAPARAQHVIHNAFTIAFALQGAVWGRELILGLIGRKVAEDTTGSLGNAMAIIRLLVSVTLFALAIVVILANLGVNVTGLIAGLGVGGIAIGLAAQGIFSDLFAALSILFDKPFKKGDTIRYDQSTGTVERIGLKTTRLRSLTGEQLIMANTKLLEREIHNMAAAKARRVTIYLAVAGRTSSDAIETVIAAASEAAEARNGCKFVRCVLSGAGGEALTYEFLYDDSNRDPDLFAGNRSAILRALIEKLGADKLKLVRASDQQTAPLPF
jgi:small-conductance mechanosensitive channel